MSGVVGQQKQWSNHRLTTHRMHDRGQSHVIADFFDKGACGGFSEIAWLSRSPLVQTNAKAMHAYCPLLTQCGSYRLNKGLEDSGIWGAMTKAERQRETRRQQKRCAAPQRPRRPDVVAQQQGAA